jgi:FixJ family two-component response regulator
MKKVFDKKDFVLIKAGKFAMGDDQLAETGDGKHLAFLTGSSDSADIERAKEMGAVDYINKPVSKDELLEKVKKALKAA